MLAAHNPGDIVDLGFVGDHHHAVIKRVGFLVECQHLFARAGAPRHHRARKLGKIIDVRRTAKGEHQVVGEVNQQRNRALACAFQARLQPIGRGAIGDAGDDAAIERRAAFRIVSADFHRAIAALSKRGDRNRLQRPQPLRRKIAGDAVNTHAVRAVGRHRDLDHRVGTVVIGETRAHRRVVRQFDDPVVIFAQFQLADRAHHTVGFDPADRALAQHHAVGRNNRPGQAQHALHPRAGIGCAAHDLQRIALSGIDGEHLQLVSIGVARGGQHVGDAETGQLVRRVFDAFDLKSDGVQRIADFGHGGSRLKVILEPGERELHAFAPTPADSVG